MYNNMEITIFGMKLEIWIIILILFFIIFSHIGCSCTNIGLLEGLNHIQNMMYIDCYVLSVDTPIHIPTILIF